MSGTATKSNENPCAAAVPLHGCKKEEGKEERNMKRSQIRSKKRLDVHNPDDRISPKTAVVNKAWVYMSY
jgi:hypothetical protein